MRQGAVTQTGTAVVGSDRKVTPERVGSGCSGTARVNAGAVQVGGFQGQGTALA